MVSVYKLWHLFLFEVSRKVLVFLPFLICQQLEQVKLFAVKVIFWDGILVVVCQCPLTGGSLILLD